MKLVSRRIRSTFAGLALASVGVASAAGVAEADYRSEVMADSPYAYHRLDETSGSASLATVMADEIPGGTGFHNAVPTAQMNQAGAITAQSPNRAIRYLNTGTTLGQSYASLPIAPLADFSLEFWVKTTQTPAGSGQWYVGQGLVDSETNGVASDFGTALMSGGRVAFGLGGPDTTITSVASVNNGAWHHVVATRSGSDMKLYIDGALDASGSGPAGVRNGTDGSYSIGDIHGAATNVGLDGYLDEVAIYTDDLPPAAVTRHFAAATAVLPPPPTAGIGLYFGGLGSGRISGTNGYDCPSSGPGGVCGGTFPLGSTYEFTGTPAKGSRFSGFTGADCPPVSAGRCRLVLDDPTGELVVGRFLLTPGTLGGEMFETFNKDARQLESALDGSVNPKNGKSIEFDPVRIQRCGCELGVLAGALAVNIPKPQTGLIGQDGATLISDKSGGLNPVAAGLRQTAGLLSDKGAGILTEMGSGLIGQDGATLIGQDGATLIGQDGATLAMASGGKQPKPKMVTYALGSYGADISAGGDIKVKFTATRTGRKIMRTIGEQNLKLRRMGKRPRPLEAMYVEAIRPVDGKGTGGAYKTLKIK